MKKLLFIPILALMLMGCDSDPRGEVTPDQQPNTEKNYRIKFLFEVDGVKVYRFSDGRSVYFTVPSGSTYYEQTRRVNKNHHTTDRVECVTPITPIEK